MSKEIIQKNFSPQIEINFCEEPNFDEIIFFNKRFHNLKSNGAFLLSPQNFVSNEKLHKKFSKALFPEFLENKKQVFVSVSDFINKLLKPLKQNGFVIESFSQYQLLGYNYTLIEKFSSSNEKVMYDSIKNEFYHMRNFNDKFYLPADADLQLKDNPNIYHPHKNIFWGFSTFGGAVFVFENDSTFIREQFEARVFGEYFKIFLLVIHQNLLLTKTGKIISYFVTKEINNSPKFINVIKKINSIRNKFLSIITRCWFPSVSNNFMYNGVYEKWREIFRVEQMYDDISIKIKELDEYLERHYQKSIQKRATIIEIIGFILLPISIITGFWGMNFKEIAGSGISIFAAFPLIVNILFIVVIVLLFFVINRNNNT